MFHTHTHTRVCTRYPGYEGVYPVPSAKGYALHTLGPWYGEMYTHNKTLKQNYK